jgi:hypothetical protein
MLDFDQGRKDEKERTSMLNMQAWSWRALHSRILATTMQPLTLTVS